MVGTESEAAPQWYKPKGKCLDKRDKIADTTKLWACSEIRIHINEWVKTGSKNTWLLRFFLPGRIPDIKYYTKQIEATTGWDDHNPQPPDLNMGIWQDVFISAEGPVSLDILMW